MPNPQATVQRDEVTAGVIVTGTEVLSGQVTDRNGPWISERLGDLGVRVISILCVGDRPEDLGAALDFMAGQGLDLVFTSGGLGPTADDLTAQTVADHAGREMRLDEDMEARIADILAGYAKRWNFDPDALAESNRKQAMVPEGAEPLNPVGTAPGLVVPGREGQVIVVLPGPPRELQGMWDSALATGPVSGILSRTEPYRNLAIRMHALPESELAASLREIEEETDLSDLEIVTCLRGGEIYVDVRYRSGAEAAADAVREGLRARHERFLFSEEGELADQVVARLLAGRTVAVAESCTGGMLAARLTDRPGASEHFLGGVVSYSNEAKEDLLGVDPGLIEREGAVSQGVAEAMAQGALERFGSDFALAVTGIAGPEGGTDDKPVGTVWICAASSDGQKLTRDPLIPGDRASIRLRTVVVALHLLRHLITGQEPPR